jgi:hypothetical protein
MDTHLGDTNIDRKMREVLTKNSRGRLGWAHGRISAGAVRVLVILA